jgi:hypothetical protein
MFLKLASTGAIFSILAYSTAFGQELPPLSNLQEASHSPTTMPSGSPLDEPIRQIADTGGGCAVLDKDFPGLRQHSMYPFFKSLSLNQIAAMSKGQITADMLAQAKTDLTALNASTRPVAGPTPLATSTASAASEP